MGVELVVQWRMRVNRMKDAHYLTATVLEQLHLRLGIPVIVLSAIVGTAVFASLQKATSLPVQVGVGLLSLSAAVLASLQTFLRHSERAEKHRVAGARYGGLNAELELLEAFPPRDPAALEETLKSFVSRWAKVREDSPAIPPHLWRRFDRQDRSSGREPSAREGAER